MRKNYRLIIYIAAAAAAAFLIIFTVVLNSRVRRLTRSVESQRELILEESTQYRENDDFFNQISGMLSLDLNQTRASLGLPVARYPVLPGSNDKNTDPGRKDSVFYDAVSVMIQSEEDNRKSAAIGDFLRTQLIMDFLLQKDLKSVKVTNTQTRIEHNQLTLVSIEAASENEIVLTDFSGESLNTRTASREALYFIENSLKSLENAVLLKKRMSEQLKDIVSDPQIKKICEKSIKINNNDEDSLLFSTERNDNKIRIQVSDIYSPVFRMTGSPDFTDYDDLYSELVSRLTSFDLRTAEEVLIDNSRKEINRILDDLEFNAYLSSLNLKMSPDVREDNDYIYYDIIHSDDRRLGSFSILKKLGDIYLVDADEIPISSLKTIGIKKTLSRPSDRKLIIPENIPNINNLYSNEDSITFLLVGTHEKNTDTMILVHADKTTGKASMIGIPRDLYWKGRKINSIYQYFGPEQLNKELSLITGLNISNYIIVDMYAFIDIINILGGIEVSLDEDLVDPTYKIRENGEWSTLNYPRGTYNLNGIEALRIARSRHGSNDFDRSQRQQLVIESFLNRFRGFNLTDVDKVYGLIQAMYEYVDTDFTIFDLMSIYNAYGSSHLTGKHVLSFDNILYDTYSNIYLLDDKEAELPPDYNKGAWILLPQDNDWNNIRWYVRQIINGEL
ncbi:MAG: LCP family protein [Spirochaetales bacterium]|nr:LCP family protein [Spirochaetales bacterium]